MWNVLKWGLNFFKKTIQLYIVLYISIVPWCFAAVTLVFRWYSELFSCSVIVPECSPVLPAFFAISLEFCCFVSVPCSVFWRSWFYSMPPPTITHQMPARTAVVCERTNWQLLPIKLRFLLQICMRISRSYWTLPSGIGMWLDLRQRKKLVKFLHFSLLFYYQIISTYYKHLQQTKWKWKCNIKYKHTTLTEPYAYWKAISQLKIR